MINVLVMELPQISNVGWWRVYRPLQAVRKMYPNAFDFRVKREGLTYQDAWWADVLILSRPFTKPYCGEFLQEAKEAGCKIVIDLDDDIFGLPQGHQLYHHYKAGTQPILEAERAFKLADLFWFSTEKFLETYTKNGLVVPNAIFPEEMPEAPAPDLGRWAWRGNTVQYHDILGVGREWYAEHRDEAKSWTFCGILPPMDHAENVETLPHIEHPRKYFQAFSAARFNGIWKPLTDCRFNDHKSNIAMIEAAMGGGICVTNYAGKPGWETALTNIPTYDKAVETWSNSKKLITEQYNLWTTAQQRAQSLAALCSPPTDTLPPTETT